METGTSGFHRSTLHGSSQIHRGIWQRKQANSLMSTGTWRMRESKQANNSYPRDELVDAFSTAESSEGWCSICWFCHVTCENKSNTKKTNGIVILSALTVTTHTKVIIAPVWRVVLHTYQFLSLCNILRNFSWGSSSPTPHPSSPTSVPGFPFPVSLKGWLEPCSKSCITAGITLKTTEGELAWRPSKLGSFHQQQMQFRHDLSTKSILRKSGPSERCDESFVLTFYFLSIYSS